MLLPNILFRLADCEHILPPPPSIAATLRSPVDRRGTHPQQVGDGAISVPADLQGKVGKALQPGAEVAPINVVPKDGAVIEPSHHHVLQDPRSIEARLPRHLNQLP